jgi:hypothetical protein
VCDGTLVDGTLVDCALGLLGSGPSSGTFCGLGSSTARGTALEADAFLFGSVWFGGTEDLIVGGAVSCLASCCSACTAAVAPASCSFCLDLATRITAGARTVLGAGADEVACSTTFRIDLALDGFSDIAFVSGTGLLGSMFSFDDEDSSSSSLIVATALRECFSIRRVSVGLWLSAEESFSSEISPSALMHEYGQLTVSGNGKYTMPTGMGTTGCLPSITSFSQSLTADLIFFALTTGKHLPGANSPTPDSLHIFHQSFE